MKPWTATERRAARDRVLQSDFGCGLLLGCGLGAFVDGIVLHQLLQWHNMLSSVRPPLDLLAMKYNMLYDGLFHAAAWLVTAAGAVRLVRLAQRGEGVSGGRLAGGALAGWGSFNVIEGLLAHQLFGLHHVRPGPGEAAWDWGFVLASALLVVIGLRYARRSTRRYASA